PLSESCGVLRRVDLGVIVKIDIGVTGLVPRWLPGRKLLRVRRLPSGLPGTDTCRPLIEILVGVAAGGGLFGSVQAQGDEAGGDLLGTVPVRAIRHHDRYPMTAAEIREGRRKERLVPRLDGVSNPAVPRALRPASPLQPAVVLSRELRRLHHRRR